MPKNMKPFVMFEGRAEEAITFYVASIPTCQIVNIERYDGSGPEPAGSVKSAVISICGQQVRFFDSYVQHAFTFTPSISFFIDAIDEAELDLIASKLGDGGEFLMPPNNYGFSKKFAWLKDKFGVSWQVNAE
jgi:predicted 3-demethylubiquinone-9 3-methyltransferase (glyoxalase superfamily)